MIRLIAALDSRRGIATDVGIPWKLPGDTAYFRRQTETGLIVMGRATYQEFDAPLHQRENFVLTTAAAPLRPGFRSIRSLGEAVAADPGADVWVIGGAATYAETIDAAEALFLTQVFGDFACTKFFPPYEGDFELDTRGEEHQDGTVGYVFETWRVRSPRAGRAG
jgi:dihydrofolate reductase